MIGEDFLQVAGRLALKPGATPGDIRTSIGRSYYGAFHFVLQLLEELGVKKTGAQHDLDRYLTVSTETVAMKAGDLLKDLYADRRKADYKPDAQDVEDPNRARLCLERARKVQSLIEQCRQEPLRSAIVVEITAWQSKTRKT